MTYRRTIDLLLIAVTALCVAMACMIWEVRDTNLRITALEQQINSPPMVWAREVYQSKMNDKN